MYNIFCKHGNSVSIYKHMLQMKNTPDMRGLPRSVATTVNWYSDRSSRSRTLDWTVVMRPLCGSMVNIGKLLCRGTSSSLYISVPLFPLSLSDAITVNTVAPTHSKVSSATYQSSISSFIIYRESHVCIHCITMPHTLTQ